MNDLQNENKEIRFDIGKQCKFFLMYQLIFIGVNIVGFIILSIPHFNDKNGLAEIDKVVNSAGGLISLCALVVGALYVFLLNGGTIIQQIKKKSNVSMKVSALLLSIVLLFTAQSVFSVLFSATESVANLFGYTTLSNDPTDIYYLIYAAFFGPVMEEIVFRGVILNGLKRYGKNFSIVVSSILFAIFHGNVAQGGFALLCGLVLGYIATEYSIKWSICIHIFNNLGISILLSSLISELSGKNQEYVNLVFIILGFIGGILVLLFQYGNIKEFIKKNSAKKGTYKVAFTSKWFVISMIVGVLMITFSFTKM